MKTNPTHITNVFFFNHGYTVRPILVIDSITLLPHMVSSAWNGLRNIYPSFSTTMWKAGISTPSNPAFKSPYRRIAARQMAIGANT
jgi:hypothetical protein